MDFDPWSTVKTVTNSFGSIDPKLAQLETAKKALQLYKTTVKDGENPLIDISIAAAEGDVSTLFDILSNPENLKYVTEVDSQGLTPINYAIGFKNDKILDILLSSNPSNINQPDRLIGYTPLMWAVHFKNEAAIIELLNHGADIKAKNDDGLSVFSILSPGSEMYSFFEQHGLIKEHEKQVDVDATDSGFYKESSFLNANSEDNDLLMDNIKLKTAGLTLASKDDSLYNDPSGFVTSQSLFEEEFDWNKLVKNQFIKFNDYDIPSLLDLIFEFNGKFAHKTTYPAAVIFQCVRYADHIKESDSLVENFLNLAFTRIRSNTSSKGGVTSVKKEGDIVLQSYWLSVVNFLYYYLCRDDGFFKRYPKVLQELITTLHSLIIELTNSIEFRLNDLIDDCLMNYVNIPEISKTLYKNDWNFFKKKHHPKTTYDEIYLMLYPPSVKEQLKPSPIKITQTLGALLYVLDLHNVSSLITQQTLSCVLYWISTTLFNRVMSHPKKYFSRAKAIQLRLNVSVVEDWVRSNDRQPKYPEIDNDILKEFPYNLIGGVDKLTLRDVLRYREEDNSYNGLKFYHMSLFSIMKLHFEPFFEVLQFLQCFTMLKDEASLRDLINNLKYLNSNELFRMVDKYKYEIDEVKFPKELKNLIYNKTKTENQQIKGMNYTGKELLYLNSEYSFPVALPTIQELIDQYGAGLGGLNKHQSLQYQPLLPYEIWDMIDEVHDQNGDDEDEENYENRHKEESNEELDEKDRDDEKEAENDGGIVNDKGDELFKELSMPGSLVHKDWGEDDVNPWN